MRIRIYIIVALVIVSVVTGLYLLKNRYGDIRPALLPAESRSLPNNTSLKISPEYTVGFFAQNLGGVRDLEFSPEGTLLASVPSARKVITLKNGQPKDLLDNLNNPHGLAFLNNKLFVAEERRVVRYNWNETDLTATEDKVLFNLPPKGNHFTRSLVFDKSGRLFISVGSTCNVCNESDPRYAAVLISDAEGSNPRVFAKGLRNSVFLALNEQLGEIWVTEMGRDFLGDDVPPDEINILKDSRDYGWPNCYGNKIADTGFNPNANCDNTEPPVYEIPAHSAPLGLAFINSPQFPNDWQGDLLVAYHGSWNRSTPAGYKVVRVKVNGNQTEGEEDFLNGFLQGNQTLGRPVDLIFDQSGNLYISDDKAGVVYIVRKK